MAVGSARTLSGKAAIVARKGPAFRGEGTVSHGRDAAGFCISLLRDGKIYVQLFTIVSRYELDTFGIDLSPAMIGVARRDHPGLRFEVGSMTDLDLADSSVSGLVAWYSLIHVPDDEISSVFAQFRRVLRPGGPLLISFHIGNESRLKTQGYGGHPMKIYVHRRQQDQMASWLNDAGFTVEAQLTLSSAESTLGGILFARRHSADGRR
jgi:SAM-dependent methyltransferase